MDAQKTKEYLKQVFDIEMALHTHKKLMEDFQTKRQKERPNTPEFSFYKKPEPPKRLHNETERKLCDFGLLNNEAIQIVVCFGIGGLFGLFFLIGFFTLMSEMGQGGSWVDGGQAKAFLLFLGLGLATAIPIFIGLKIWKRETDYIIQRDKNAYEKYTKDLAQYNQQYETSKKIYDDRLARTQSQIVTYDKVTNVETANLNGSLYKLEKSLKQLYDVNIIYLRRALRILPSVIASTYSSAVFSGPLTFLAREAMPNIAATNITTATTAAMTVIMFLGFLRLSFFFSFFSFLAFSGLSVCSAAGSVPSAVSAVSKAASSAASALTSSTISSALSSSVFFSSSLQ